MKRTIRLNESELKQIIYESVKKTINEVGETIDGQDKLGRLHGKKSKKGEVDSAKEIEKYAKKKATKPFKGGFTRDSKMLDAFEKGNDEEYFKESKLSKLIKETVGCYLKEHWDTISDIKHIPRRSKYPVIDDEDDLDPYDDEMEMGVFE